MTTTISDFGGKIFQCFLLLRNPQIFKNILYKIINIYISRWLECFGVWVYPATKVKEKLDNNLF